METWLTCTLCGHQFDPSFHASCQNCPLNPNCNLVCCPQCGHATVDPGRSRLARWLGALLPKGKEADDRSIP